MEKKKAIYIAIIVVIALLGYVILSSNKSSVTSEDPSMKNTMTNEMKPATETPKDTPKDPHAGHASPPATLNGKFMIDKAESKLAWQGKKTLLTSWIDEGNISVQDGYGEFKDGKLVAGMGAVDMKSIATSKTGSGGGQDKLTKHLSSADFFDAEKYPTSKFTITSATTTDGMNYQIKGSLTIKDKTSEIEFPATIHMDEDGDEVMVEGKALVDRTKFEVKFGSGKFFDNLGNNVIDDFFTLDLKLVGKMEMTPKK